MDAEQAVQQQWGVIRHRLNIADDDFEVRRLSIYCTICHSTLRTVTSNAVTQHLNRPKHQKVIELRAHGSPRVQEESHELTSPRQNPFFKEMCDAFTKSDIPLEKLNYPPMKSFLERYTQQTIPHPSTIRKSYVDICYDETINKIRAEVGDAPICIIVDETTDSQKRCVCNIIVIPLDRDRARPSRLLNCETVDRADANHIIEFIINSLNLLWPNGIHYDRVLFLISDSVRYMKAAGRALKVQCPLLIHHTCTVHGLHLVATEIMDEYPDLNNVIADTKKVFLKAPRRIELFHNIAPGIPLPPEPILTRWGTWLLAVAYYAQYFNAVSNVIDRLEPENQTIVDVKAAFELEGLADEFNYVNEKFCCISRAIKLLEAKDLEVTDAMKILGGVVELILGDEDIDIEIKNKLRQVLGDNDGFIISLVNLVRSMANNDHDNLPEGWTPEMAQLVRFVPIVSCDVERSFSKYKLLMRSNRSSMCFENTRKLVIINCFQ